MCQQLKFVVIDDHPLIRESMKAVLSDYFKVSRVEVFPSVEAALELLTAELKLKEQSDWWVLMDLGLGGISGLAAIRLMLALGKKINLITMSGNDDELHVGACLGAGVRAFISKGTDIDNITDLLSSFINKKEKDGVWLSINGIVEGSVIPKIRLTERQTQVLSMICEGRSNKDIAFSLGITEITAKSHVGGIFKELKVMNRTQAVLAAQKLGLVTSKI